METKSYRCKAQWPNNNGSSIIAIYEQNIKKSATTKTTRYIPKGSKHDKVCQKKVVLKNFNFNNIFFNNHIQKNIKNLFKLHFES
jgi:hypothetical protein